MTDITQMEIPVNPSPSLRPRRYSTNFEFPLETLTIHTILCLKIKSTNLASDIQVSGIDFKVLFEVHMLLTLAVGA